MATRFENLEIKATEAVERLFQETTVARAETREALQRIRDNIDEALESLPDDDDAEE